MKTAAAPPRSYAILNYLTTCIIISGSCSLIASGPLTAAAQDGQKTQPACATQFSELSITYPGREGLAHFLELRTTELRDYFPKSQKISLVNGKKVSVPIMDDEGVDQLSQDLKLLLKYRRRYDAGNTRSFQQGSRRNSKRACPCPRRSSWRKSMYRSVLP